MTNNNENNPNSRRIPKGTIHSTIFLLKNALIKLDAAMDEHAVEEIGIMIQQAMSMQHRSFHTPEHIFDLIVDDDPHYALAAAFHDVVYFQVDRGFHGEIENILSPYLEISGDSVKLRTDIAPSDRAFFGTASIFGFSPGQVLSPFAGLNEFLSALVMNSLLEGHVPDTELLVATAGIEMTIPFRGKDKNGLSPAEALAGRIRETSRIFGLKLSEDKITSTVISAVTLANRDIANFAEEDSARFLDNTWRLLPESNPELFFKGLYTIRSYAASLRKMEGFLSGLKPETVFQQFSGFPEENVYNTLLERTKQNLQIAREYLGVKMISAGILQALSELSGGDAPVSFFMGDIQPEEEWCSLTYHLPDSDKCLRPEGAEDSILYQLFKYGRSDSSDFDMQNSPLSFFIYCNLDDSMEKDCIDASRSFLNNEMSPLSFLQAIPGVIIKNIALAASVIAFTRRDELKDIAKLF